MEESLEQRLVELESRLAFQEEAIERLTRTAVHQDKALAGLRAELERLRGLLAQLSPPPVGEDGEEPPPPHY